VNKKALLEEARQIRKCKECKLGKTGKAVPGEGDPDAKIVFVGEAPGKEESKVGRPFIGRSGKFLRTLIKNIGLDEKEIYITSPVKYLPKKGTPTKQDVVHGSTHLQRQLEIISPKIVVLLGNVAFTALIRQNPSASLRHGEVIKKDNRTYFVTFHPAAAIRFPKIKAQMVEDFKKLRKLIWSKKIGK